MQILSRRAHGVLDYLVGLALIFSPRVLNFEGGSDEAGILLAVGLATISYSVLTRYELGLVRLIPFRAHLALDVASGLVLLASPWLFGFADHIRLPHVVFALLELGVVTMTRMESGTAHSGTLARS
jgi:hypothetical protein